MIQPVNPLILANAKLLDRKPGDARPAHLWKCGHIKPSSLEWPHVRIAFSPVDFLPFRMFFVASAATLAKSKGVFGAGFPTFTQRGACGVALATARMFGPIIVNPNTLERFS
jgi:hypothetical protein